MIGEERVLRTVMYAERSMRAPNKKSTRSD